jgi:hypothetical protein
VSPSPEKGLALVVSLARAMPDVPFAAVVTQWTGSDTLAALAPLPNVTILQAHPDVDRIFVQTKILLAPSLWQECCPLIVMEACLRGIPCVSSDVFGLPMGPHLLTLHAPPPSTPPHPDDVAGASPPTSSASQKPTSTQTSS